jgi:predicted ferric reductase
MTTSNTIATGVTVMSLLWMWLYMVLGGSQFGRDQLYFPLAQHFYGSDYYQAGLVVLVLVIPVLLSGTLASLLLCVEETTTTKESRQRFQHYLLQRGDRRWWRSCISSSWTATVAVFAIMIVPCGIYVVTSISRKLPKAPTNDDGRLAFLLMIIANSFSFLSLLAMAWIFIPVSRQSSLLVVLSPWLESPIQAIQYIHVTSGYLVLLGVLIHSVLHLWRFHVMGELWADVILPPSFCWKLLNAATTTTHLTGGDDDGSSNSPEEEIVVVAPEAPQCHNPDTECSCYHHFRNLTGVMAFLAFLLLALFSLWPCIRRRAYALFYMVHVMAAPLAVIMTVMHYPRAILYVAPSLLYYVASSFPNMMEMQRQQKRRLTWSGGGTCQQQDQGGVTIVSVQAIPSITSGASLKGTIISLRLEATAEAMRRFRPGQYVQLTCPELSMLAQHPFTINAVPRNKNKNDNQNNVLAIHFRVCGPFTTRLAARLVSPTSPLLYLNGFFGSMHRFEQVLQHDAVVIVAGGIGITPYLSLVHDLVTVVSQDDDSSDDDGIGQGEADHHVPKRRNVVVLHWVCRDESFADYIREEYFQPLLDYYGHEGDEENYPSSQSLSNKLSIRIVIHRTSGLSLLAAATTRSPFFARSYTNLPGIDDKTSTSLASTTPRHQGVPFTPSKFAVGTNSGIRDNVLPFVAFALIAWLGLGIVWYQYTRVIQPTAEEQVSNRVWSVVGIVVLAWVVSWLVNVCTPEYDETKPCPKRRSRRGNGFLRRRAKSHGSDNEDNNEGEERLSIKGVELQPLSMASAEETVCSEQPSTNVEKHHRPHLITNSNDSRCGCVSLKETEGRPSVHELLSALDGAHSPGLFVCGPTSLMQDIRKATQERCLLRIRHCTRGSPHIALYEEAFEI